MVFTKQEFEDALKEALITITHGDRSLAKLKRFKSPFAHERAYTIQLVGTNKRIMIRTSMPPGRNATELWVEYFYKNDWFASGGPCVRIAHESDWQPHMADKLQVLWNMALEDDKYQPTKEELAEIENWNDHLASRRPTPSLQPVSKRRSYETV